MITYKQTVAPPHVTDVGTFKGFYNTGTIHGVYKENATIPTTGTTVTATGPIKVLGGTGAFAGAKGKGTLTCVTNDGGNHFTCVAKF